MSPASLTTANALEDAPQSQHCYEVTAGDQTYTIAAADSYTAERKGRAMFREAFGIFPTHVSARMVTRKRIIESVDPAVIVIRPVDYMAVGVHASEMVGDVALVE